MKHKHKMLIITKIRGAIKISLVYIDCAPDYHVLLTDTIFVRPQRMCEISCRIPLELNFIGY